MTLLSLIYLFLPLFLFISCNAQPLIQGNSHLVEFGQRVVTLPQILPSFTSRTFTSTITVSKIQIPLAQWRKPFISLSSIESFRTTQNREMRFFLQRFLQTSTRFNVKFLITRFTFNGVTRTNWPLSVIVKFYYLVLSASLPDAFVSDRLQALDGAHPKFPGTWTKTHTFGQWTGNAPLDLMLPTVRFVHALIHHEIESIPRNNQFSLRIKFIPITKTKFNILISSDYMQEVNQLRLCLFIYDQAVFDSINIKIRDGYQILPPFGINTLLQHFTFHAWPNYPGMIAIVGLAGYEFSSVTFGFDIRFEITTYSDILGLTVQNLMSNTIEIPEMQVSFLTISQLTCPNNVRLIDQAITTCLSSCPAGQNPSTSPLPYISLYTCEPCTTCCPSGQYLNGVCVNCLSDCEICSTGSVCISCKVGFILDSTGACVSSIPCTSPCIACDAWGCNQCTSPYIPSGLVCICPPGTIDISGICKSCNDTLQGCLKCSSQFQCDQCDFGFYLTNNNDCQACSEGCISCDASGCVQCVPVLNLDSSKECTCPNGSYYNSSTLTCDPCSDINGCADCTSSTTCSTCTPGYYLSANICTLCLNPISNCLQCTSSSSCTVCITGYFIDTADQCQPCGFGCSTCTNSASCQQCQSQFIINSTYDCVCPNGFYYDSGSSSCVSCTPALTGCSQCSSSTVCSLCEDGYYLPTGGSTCLFCSSGCITCDSSGCTQCQANFFTFTDNLVTPSIICKECKLYYGNQCLFCDSIQCTKCTVDSFWWELSNECILFSSVKCGDGQWIDFVQTCDDGNLNNGDGCNSQCQIQDDYDCPLSDKLPSGASLCKFTKDLSVTFDRLEKQVSTNIVQLYLNLQPATFSQWDSQTISDLLNPLQIINSQTGTIFTIPINSISISFVRNPLNNQVQLTIDYGPNNLEGTELRFNINPSATNLQSLHFLSVKNNLSLKIQSKNTGVYLYGYDETIYSAQSAISNVSYFIGSMGMLFAFFGLLIPSGKLIIVQALAVIQISYFSILQFQKIPPTYAGFRNLIISNGFNDQDIFSETQTTPKQNIYKLLGLETSALSNINISLIIFILLPTIIGGIGLLVTKLVSKQSKQAEYKPFQDEKNSKLQSPEKQKDKLQSKSNKDENQIVLNTGKCLRTQILNSNLKQSTATNPQNSGNSQEKKINEKCPETLRLQNSNFVIKKLIFERVLYENTLYGIFISSYLAWISIFNSFSQLKVGSIMIMLTFLGFILVYGFIFCRTKRQKTSLISQSKKFHNKDLQKKQSQTQKLQFQTEFGQFSDICTRPSVEIQNPLLRIIQKIALLFLFERLLSAIFIVFISTQVQILGVLITFIEIGLLISLLMARKIIKRLETQTQEQNQQKKKKEDEDKIILQVEGKSFENKAALQKPSPLIFFYQNYLFRQALNSITVILIQILYLIANIMMENQDQFEVFVKNQFVTKIMPIIVSSLLLLNLGLNYFLWVNQIRFNQLFLKAKLIWEHVFGLKNVLEIKIDQNIYPDKASQSQKEEDEVVQQLNKFIETSAILRAKESPFLGIREKEASKEALLGLLKVEQIHKIKMSGKGKMIRKRLIDEVWDEI